ncbi:hypothetical protein ACFV4P_24510 [Kitasatospora sp. NPDC059795]|uniref:hypothetical protein n=1 Tax=Kitasatospora sp. NPDC059795 TaxID=3346949 RepID=UPI00365FE883
MADRANFVIVRESGEFELYLSRFGAVGIDLDLLAGPAETLAMVEGLRRDDWWLDDGICQGAALIDLGRRVLLLFVWEGPTVGLRRRAVAMELLREAWAGWEVRWLYDGNAEVRAHLGLDPEFVRDRESPVCPGPLLAPDDEDLTDPEPMAAVVTLGPEQAFVVANIADHPIREGAALLDRLADAPEHGVCRVAAEAGVHLDPVRRHVGWWTSGAVPEAYAMPERWPGWTVEFWQDRWEEHVRHAPGRFQPQRQEAELTRREILAEVEERRLRQPSPPAPHWPQATADPGHSG